MSEDEERQPVLDLLGIGFGPSNLALAIALHEHNQSAGDALRAGFFERQPCFGWHRGMLLDDATMQVSFLKDLVTLRDPTSKFSFLCYLRQRGRLVDFINHKTLFPLRIEFHDYLEWAAARMDHLVDYDSEVVDVRPVITDEVVEAFDVVARRGRGTTTVRRARNLVVAVGLEPTLPPEVELSERVWHNLDLLDRMEGLPASPPPRRFVVVGAGQSAAEVTGYLHRTFPEAEVCAVFSRYGYSAADDNPFANRIFDPGAVDTYFHAPREVKRMLFDYHRNTNYSVVDGELIEELYRRRYREKVQGRCRLRIMNASRVVGTEPLPDRVEVTVHHLPSSSRRTLTADVVVYATGYQPVDVVELLGECGELCRTDREGMLRVSRDYRIATSVPTCGDIYLQGGTEHAHGITSTLLSTVAVRADEIVESVAEHARDDAGVDATVDLRTRPSPGGEAGDRLLSGRRT